MVIYGKQVFLYTLKRHPSLIEEIYLAKEVDKKLFNDITKLNKKIIRVDAKKAQALARGGNHQGFLLRIKEFDFVPINALKKSDFLLVLVGITDVGNIGAIVRSAYALGVDGIVASGINKINLEAVIRTSSGAALDMPISLYKDTKSLLNELSQVGFKSYVADIRGEDIAKIKAFAPKRVLLLGSEGEGVPKGIINRCDNIVKIPMERDFDSLNVSAAAAIFCDRMR